MIHSLRISVADDEPDLREYYERVLIYLGHSVVSSSSNGLELLNECRNVKPDLVISDVRMPVMDGLDAAEQIVLRYHLPMILVSAFHSPEMVARANAAAVCALLTKPVTMDELFDAIESAWQKHLEHVLDTCPESTVSTRLTSLLPQQSRAVPER